MIIIREQLKQTVLCYQRSNPIDISSKEVMSRELTEIEWRYSRFQSSCCFAVSRKIDLYLTLPN